MELHVSLGILEEHSIGYERMEVQVQIQGRAKSLDASDGSAERFYDSLPASAASLPSKQCAQKQRERQTDQLGPPCEQKAELHRQCQYPLPNRNGRKHTVPKVCCKVGHPPAGTRRTKPPILAGEGDEQLIVASRTADAGKAVAKESATQVALKLGADEAGKLAAGIPILGFDEKGSQVFAHDAVEQTLFGLPTLVADPRRGRTADSQRLFG